MIAQLQSGPCISCGKRDYPLSCGGPTICPSCDCGIDPLLARCREDLHKMRMRNILLSHYGEVLITTIKHQPFLPNAVKVAADNLMAAIKERD